MLSFVILGQLWLAHHRIFGVIARVDYAVLVRNLVFLGLIAVMPFPVRLLSDYPRRPLAVASYAVAFITAMQLLQRLLWLEQVPARAPGPAQGAGPGGGPRRLRPGPAGLAGGVRRGGAGGDVRPGVRDAGVGGDHPAAVGGGTAHQLAMVAADRDLTPSAYPRASRWPPPSHAAHPRCPRRYTQNFWAAA